MRTAHKTWCWIAAGMFVLVAITDLSTSAGSAPASASSAATSAVSSPSPTVGPSSGPSSAAVAGSVADPVAASGSADPDAEVVSVTRVIDGDTFVADGQEVRVLGIDSCEAATAGGREATAAAKDLLGSQVTLRAEPGVDRDRYDRELRYVELADGTDYAEAMVVFDHTGVYRGRNDAPASYVRQLRDADPNGRTCTAPAPVSSSDDEQLSSGSGGSIDWPSPGDQGMRDGALTGGYCKRKWWC